MLFPQKQVLSQQNERKNNLILFRLAKHQDNGHFQDRNVKKHVESIIEKGTFEYGGGAGGKLGE